MVGIPNGSSEGGREIIGQEMVIHRTLQTIPAAKHASISLASPTMMSSALAPLAPGLVTPKRPTTRPALPDQEERGKRSDVREEESQLVAMRPLGNPVSYGPQGMVGSQEQLPLFNPDQLGRLRDIQGQAPWLYTEAPIERIEEVSRPASLNQLEGRMTAMFGQQQQSETQLAEFLNEAATLRQDIVPLMRRNDELRTMVEAMERKLVPLRETNEELRGANLELRGVNFQLKKEIEMMKIRLSQIELSGNGDSAAYATPGQIPSPEAPKFVEVTENDNMTLPKNVRVPEELEVSKNDRVLEEFGVVKNVKVQGENEALEANRVTEENDAFENDKYKRSEDPQVVNWERFWWPCWPTIEESGTRRSTWFFERHDALDG